MSTQPAGVRRVPLIMLYLANTISICGSVFTAIAVPWFVLQTTGSPAKMGITAATEIIAMVLAAFLGGTIVDRIGNKSASMLADIISGLAIAAIPVLYATIGLAFWQLIALVALSAFFNAPGGTARTTILPELAAMACLRLDKVNAAKLGVDRGSRLLGGVFAGVVISFVSTSNVLLVDAATFLTSALLVAIFVPHGVRRVAKADEEQKRGSYWADLGEGLKFSWADPIVGAITFALMVTNFLDAPWGSVILPIYASEVFHSPAVMGFAIAAYGGGALVGSALFMMIGHRLPRRATFLTMLVLVGLRYWVLALLPPLPVLLTACALTGLASAPVDPIIETLGMERIPVQLRARVFGLVQAGVTVAMPTGMLLAGYLLQVVNMRVILLAMAGAYLLFTLSLSFNRALRDMNARSASQAPDMPDATERLREMLGV